jgi:ankyrin repeat protein
MKNKISRTLRAACQKGDLKSVKFHIANNKTNINSKNAAGWFPLGAAAYGGHAEVINYLLKAGARINLRSKCGWTPLYLAAQRGHIEAVELLIENKALLNVLTKLDYNSNDRYSPLHIACERGHSAIVKLLVQAGAKVNLKNGDNETPFDTAVKFRRYKLACYLALNGAKPGVKRDFFAST